MADDTAAPTDPVVPDLQPQVDALTKQVADLTAQLAAVNIRLGHAIDSSDELQADLVAREQVLAQVQAQLTASNNSSQFLQAEIDSLEAELAIGNAVGQVLFSGTVKEVAQEFKMHNLPEDARVVVTGA